MNKDKLARIFSEMFNGFATMILTPVIAITVSPFEIWKKVLYSLIYLFIPLTTYLILRRLGKVSDYELTKREERPIYFTILSLVFGIMYFVLRKYNLEILNNTSLCIFIVTSTITVITFFWKISGHMTYSTLLFLTLLYIFNSPWILLLFLFTPFIAWSRIQLKKHTLAQVIVGTLLVTIICILIYWVF